MNPIRSLLIVLLATSILCEDNLALVGKESKNSLINSNLMADNPEIEIFGKVVNSLLQKAVNEFLIARIVIMNSDPKNTNNYRFEREISEILRISQGKIVIEVMELKYFLDKLTSHVVDDLDMIYAGGGVHDSIDICKGACLLLFESSEQFRKFQGASKLGETDVNIDIWLYYIRGTSAAEVLKLNDVGSDIMLRVTDKSNVLSIVEVAGNYELLEINRFLSRESWCKHLAMTTVNRFSKTSMEWEKPLERLERRKEFKKCPIQFTFMENQVVYPEYGEQIYSGAFVDILKLVSEIGNTTMDAQINEDFNRMFFYDKTGKGRDGWKKGNLFLYNRKADKIKQAQWQDLTFLVKELYFVVPEGELYTEWEKLFLAFDEVTWILIFVTFAAAFAVIFIIKLTSHVIKNFVFGRNFTTPAQNVLRIFFGIGQVTLPGRNFARFLLALFTIWSLIFRTCYQGLLFEYLIGDGRKPPIKSIGEMLETNFTYHTFYTHCNQLYDVSFTGRGK